MIKDKSLFSKAFIGVALCLFVALQAQAQNIDSLYAVFSASRGAIRIGAANEIVKYGYENDYLDSLVILKTTDEQALVDAIVYDAMGAYLMFEKNDFRKSIDFLVMALENFEKTGNALHVDLLNNVIGTCYVRIGDYENAVAYLMKCYEWEKNAGDIEGLSSTLNDLGVAYSHWQKKDMAIRFLEEAAKVEFLLNRPMYYANRLASLAREYSTIDAPKALQQIKEALQYDEKIESQVLMEENIATHQTTMGDIYYQLDSLENAAICYQKALVFFEKNERPYNVAFTLLGLGRLQVKAKRYSEAIATLRRCEEMAEKNNFLRIQRDASILLSETYSKLEPNTMSYVYLKKYSILNDSIFRETTQQQINDFQVQYETAEKQLEIERQQSEIAQYRTRQIIYVGGIIAAGALLAMSVYIVALHRRRNRALAEMNATKDKFFSIISHDLKNPAIAQRNILQLLADRANQTDAALSAHLRQALQTANGMVDLLKNLLNWAQIQTGREISQPSQFNLVASLQTDISVVKSMAERKGIAFDALTPPAAFITADENMLTTVVRNLLANAVKFTAAGGKVSLEITETDSKHIVAVSDTGTGMTSEQLQNLFRIDRQQSREGTAGEQGSGLGLIVCREMLQKNGSTLHVESEAGKGSRFWFEV